MPLNTVLVKIALLQNIRITDIYIINKNLLYVNHYLLFNREEDSLPNW